MTEATIPMKAIVATDQAAGTAEMTLAERPAPPAERAPAGASVGGVSGGAEVSGADTSDHYVR